MAMVSLHLEFEALTLDWLSEIRHVLSNLMGNAIDAMLPLGGGTLKDADFTFARVQWRPKSWR